MVAEVVLIEGDCRTVGILKALLGLECLAEDIARDDTVAEILKEVEYIGLNGVLTVLLHKFNLNLGLLINELVLFLLPCKRAAEIYVTVGPYRKVIELELGKLAHVGTLYVKVEVLNPLIVGRILIEVPCTGSRIGLVNLTGILVLNVGPHLDKDIVVESVITVVNGVKACNLCPVTDVVRCVTRTCTSAYLKECTADKVMYKRNAFCSEEQ